MRSNVSSNVSGGVLVRSLAVLFTTLLNSCVGFVEPADHLLVSDLRSMTFALAASRPGTTIELAAGTYKLVGSVTLTANGAVGAPVTLSAQGRDVHFVGSGGIDIRNSNWLTINGFTYEYRSRTVNVVESSNIRLSNMEFRFAAAPTEISSLITHWIRFRSGAGHRVDHSIFGPHDGSLGVTLLVENDVSSIRIDHNYFHDRPRNGANGAETIRLGSGGGSRIDAIVEDNLFENCHGESELISVKSNGAWIRNNTFRNNDGKLVVRNGKDIVISGNQFIGSDSTVHSGGLRVHGTKICVVNNYFYGITTPVLESRPGQFEIDQIPNNPGAMAAMRGYPRSTGIVFSANIVVQGDWQSKQVLRSKTKSVMIDVQSERTDSASISLLASDWVLAKNLIFSARHFDLAEANDTYQQISNQSCGPIFEPQTLSCAGILTVAHDGELWHLKKSTVGGIETLTRSELCADPYRRFPAQLNTPLESSNFGGE